MWVSGAVLAGGRSRRMGRDKRWVEVDGIPMLVRAVTAVRAVADHVQIVGGLDLVGDVPDEIADVLAIADLRAGQGPLGGIETALATAEHEVVVVVAVDHPWLNPAVLDLLVAQLGIEPEVDAAVLGSADGPQPLVAAYRRAALPTVRRLLDEGERRTMALLDNLAVAVVEREAWARLDPQGWTARDVDTPEDLAAGEDLARGEGA